MKKLLALFLGAVLAFSLMPAAFAEGELPGTITLVDDGIINSCTYEGESTAVKFGNYGTVSANPDGDGNVLKLDMSTWTSGDVNQWWDAKFVNGEKNYFTYDIYLPNDLVNDKSNNSVSLFSPALSTYTDWNDTLGWKMNDNAVGLFYYSRPTTDEGWCYFALKGADGTYTPYTVSAKKWYRVIYEIAADGTSYTAYIQNLTDGGEIAKLHEPISIGFTGIARLQLTSGSFNKNIPVCIDNVSVYSKPVANSMSVTSFGTESGLAASINLTEEAHSAAVYMGSTKVAEISDVVGGAYTLSAPWSGLGITSLEACNITLNCYDAEGNVIDTLKVSKSPSVEIKQSVAIEEERATFTRTLAEGGVNKSYTGATPYINEKGIVEYTYEFNIDKITGLYVQANMYYEDGSEGTYGSADTYKWIVSNGTFEIGSEKGNAVDSSKWYKVKVRLNSIDKTVQYWVASEGEEFAATPDYSGVNNGVKYVGLASLGFNYTAVTDVSEENPATFNVRNTTVSRIYSISDIDTEILSTSTASVAMELGTIAFDEGLAESVIIKKDGAVLTKGSEADVLVIYNTDANTLSITPKDGFAPNSKYTVEIPATASIGGATNVLSLPIVKEYLVLGEDNIYIGDIKISSDNDKYYGSFEYYNGAGVDKTVAVLLVSYAGNRVNAVNLESSVKLVNGENDEITVSVPKKDGDTSTRAFIWESVASMMPIAASK